MSGGTQATTGDWVQVPGPGQYAHGRATVYLTVGTFTSGPTVFTLEQSLDGSTAFPVSTLDGSAAADLTAVDDKGDAVEVEPASLYLRAKGDSSGNVSGISIDVVF